AVVLEAKAEEIMEKENMEVIMKTEAEAGASGFSIRGGGKEGVFVKHLIKDSPAAKSLSMREGDQLLSATIFFDNVKYEDAVKILQYSEPYRMQFCFKRNLSEAEEMETTESSLPHQMEHESMKISGETGKKQETDKSPVKKRNQKTDRTDARISWPKFQPFKSVKIDTEGEAPHQNEEMQEKIRKKQKLKFPHIGILSYKAKTEIIQEPEPFQTNKDTTREIKVGFSTPDIKSPKLDVDVSAPEAGIVLPKPEAEVKGPDVKIAKPTVDIEVKGGEVETKGLGTKLHMPKMKMPSFGLSRPEMKADVPSVEVDVKSKGAKPDIDVPSVDIDIERTKVDIEGSEGKIEKPRMKMPKFDISLPKVIGPDISLKKPTVDIEVKGGEVETKGLGTKLHMPNIKIPSFGQKVNKKEKEADISFPTGEVDIKVPDMSVTLPESEANVSIPESEMQGIGKKIKMPKLKMPKFGFSKREVKMPKLDVDLAFPTVDTSLPKTDVDIKGREIKGGEPEIDVQIAKPKTDVPFIEIGVKTKGAKPDIDLPSVDIDIESTKVEIEGSEGKIEMPRMKMPKFDISLPKVKGPDISLSMHKADIDISLPEGKIEGEGPDVNIEIPNVEAEIMGLDQQEEDIGGKLKKPKIKMPSIGFSTPEIKAPKLDVDVSASEAEIALPKPEAEIKVPDVKIEKPTVDIEIKGGEVETDGLGTKLHMPKIKMPSFGLRSITKPEVEISSSKGEIEVTVPKTDVQAPSLEVDIDTEKVEVDVPEGNIKMPSFHLPKFGMSLPSLKEPKIDFSKKEIEADISFLKGEVDVKGTDRSVTLPDAMAVVNIPESEMQGTGKKLKMPKLKIPKFGFSKPEIKGRKLKAGEPEIDVQIAQPHIDVPSFEVDVITKGSKTGIEAPSVDIDLEKNKAECDIHKLETEGPKGKFKIPKLKFPVFRISLPEVKDSTLDIDVNLPAIKGPETDIQAPLLDINTDTTEAEVKDLGGKVKKPKFKLPNFGISLSKFRGSDTEHTDVSLLKPEGDTELPDGSELEVEGKEGQTQVPAVKLSTFDVSPPKVKDPGVSLTIPKTDLAISVPMAKDMNVSLPTVGISVPKAKEDVRASDVKIKSLTLEDEVKVDKEETGGIFKLPKIKMPVFGIATSEIKDPMLDVDVSLPTVGISLPKAKEDIKASEVKLEAPTLEDKIKQEGVEMERHEGKLRIPKLKVPKFGITGPKVKADVPSVKEEVRVKVPETDIQASLLDVHIDKTEVDVEGPDGNKKKSKFKLPEFGMSLPEVKDTEITLPKQDFPKIGFSSRSKKENLNID
uniref:PDZ domain-containing protein n=1 Tax=Latimeria chalumnae TaxID=7897 RepID=H3AKJ4_LATCH